MDMLQLQGVLASALIRNDMALMMSIKDRKWHKYKIGKRTPTFFN